MSVRRVKKARAHGRYVYRWIADVDVCLPDGTHRRIRRAPRVQSRVGAERLERELLAQLTAPGQDNRPVQRSSVQVRAFWSEYWSNHVVINNRPSEQQAKKTIWTHHLAPAFGDLPLNEVTLRAVEKYKASKLGGAIPYAAKTVNNHLAILRALLHMAVAWGELVETPKFRDVKVPERATSFLTHEQTIRLLNATESRWTAMVRLAIHTGLRIGELLALQWEDVLWPSRRLLVRRSDWRGIIGPPKGGRSREVPLNELALATLHDLQHDRGDLVICTETGQRVTQAMCRRPLHRACRRAGLPLFQWHTLRHTFASLLVMRGVPLRTVQQLLGHANYATTERYAHLSPDAGSNAVEMLCGP